MEEILADPSAADTVAGVRADRRPTWIRAVPWALAVVMTLAFLVLLRTHLGTPPGALKRATHLSVVLPPHLQFYAVRPTMLAISPDGRRLATVVDDGGVQRLFLRDMDKSEGVVLAGTEGANSPFFSPDGEWVGFRPDDEILKKIPVDGGAAVVIVDDVWGRGAIWGPDDFVIFPKEASGGLWRVPAAGGTPEAAHRTESGGICPLVAAAYRRRPRAAVHELRRRPS